MPKTIGGLPVHPLLVHATVTVLPLAALLVLLAALWPTARRRLSFLPVAFSILAVILLPLSFESGDNLEAAVGGGRLVARHEHLAHQLLWPVVGLAVASLVVELTRHLGPPPAAPGARAHDRGSTAVSVTAAVLAIVFSITTVAQTVRVGEAGARAVWGHAADGHG
jgi:hypothetical protein